MARLEDWAAERLALEEPLVLAGDYNVIPEPIDARFPENWVERRAVPAAKRGRRSAGSPISASPTPCARSPTRR